MEVTEDGVALPAAGISVFGVDVRRKVVGALRDNGDWIDVTEGVLVGRGGNADGGTADLPGVAGPVGVLVEGFVGTEMFRPAAARFSTAFGVDDCGVCKLLTGTSDFLLVEVATITLAAFFLVEIAGVADVLALLLPLSRAGKSSDLRLDCEAMAFDSPVLVAKLFTSCLACEVDVSAGAF